MVQGQSAKIIARLPFFSEIFYFAESSGIPEIFQEFLGIPQEFLRNLIFSLSPNYETSVGKNQKRDKGRMTGDVVVS